MVDKLAKMAYYLAMKTKIYAVILVLCLLVGCFGLFGCNNGVSGTYKATYNGTMEMGYTVTLKLKNNGSCTLTRSYAQADEGDHFWGEYTVDDKTINLHLYWTTDRDNEDDFTATILNSGNIRMTFFGKTLTYYKS